MQHGNSLLIKRKCRENNMQVMFNYSDVYNKYFRGRNGVDSNEVVMKLLNLLKELNEVDNTRNYG